MGEFNTMNLQPSGAVDAILVVYYSDNVVLDRFNMQGINGRGIAFGSKFRPIPYHNLPFSNHIAIFLL